MKILTICDRCGKKHEIIPPEDSAAVGLPITAVIKIPTGWSEVLNSVGDSILLCGDCTKELQQINEKFTKTKKREEKNDPRQGTDGKNKSQASGNNIKTEKTVQKSGKQGHNDNSSAGGRSKSGVSHPPARAATPNIASDSSRS